VDGRIAACGGWSKRQTLYGGDQMKAGEDSLLDPATEPARIRAFFVDPDYARRGIGSSFSRLAKRAAQAAAFVGWKWGDAAGRTVVCGSRLSSYRAD
jgi:GNAT superfamily N-acetyltransferase